MIDRRQLITSRQLMTLIISTMTGVGLMSLPYLLAKKAGHDGWISITISGMVSIIMAIIVIKLLERYKDKSIFDINRILYGKYLGTAINTVYILYLGFKLSINLRVFIEIIHSIVLKTTPSIVLAVLVLICPAYLCWSGLKPICRFASTIYIIILAVLLLVAVNLKYIRMTFLMPVGESGMPSILYSLQTAAYSFLAFAFPWIVYPMVVDKEKAMRYTIWGLVISTLIFLTVVVAATGYFGEHTLKHLPFPLYSLARSYRAPVVERIDLFFMALWFPALEMSLKAYFFTTKFWIDELLGIKRKTMTLMLFTLAIIAVSYIPKDVAETNNYLEIADMIGIPLVFGMAILGYILSFINTKGVKKK